MSGTEDWKGSGDYRMVAEVRGHEVLAYHQFGSYQGEWFMLSHHEGDYHFWEGSYGSCSGCDSLEAASPNGTKAVQAFAKDYDPFISLKEQAAIKAATEDDFSPLNKKLDEYGIPWDRVVSEVREIIKIRHNLPIVVGDILEAQNAENRRLMLERFGLDAFLAEAKSEELDRSRYGTLLRFNPQHLAVLVQDASTERRYLLRVPPTTKTAHAGIAWTFGFDKVEDYRPLAEA